MERGTKGVDRNHPLWTVDVLEAPIPVANDILMARAQVELGETGAVSEETSGLMTRNLLRRIWTLPDE
jgi:hypothetical protein